MSGRASGSLAKQYRLIRRLGQGAMGAVWEAERVADGRSVALKLLKRELLREDRALHRFRREAKLSARLAHPNVVATFDSGVDDESGQPWMSMELVSGPNLATWAREHAPVPRATAVTLLRDVFAAVGHAHALSIVHRDLKPENVLLVVDGPVPRAKVSDFGIAKGLEEQSWASTEAGLGTPVWTAPEQGRAGFVPSPRADVWALGLIAFWLLTGNSYWRHDNARSSVVDLVLELERGVLASASERAAEAGASERLPSGFDAWFARAVNRSEAERFGDAREAWTALAPVLGLAPGRRSVRVLAWAALGLLVLGLVAAAVAAR